MALAAAVKRIKALVPSSLQSLAISFAFNSQVKLARTCGIRVESLDASKAVVLLKNRTRVQNHIGGVHACGIALAAESASGMVFGMNLKHDQLPLLKSMSVNYRRVSKGHLRAEAVLDAAQQELVRAQPKGEVMVPVTVTDLTSNESPVQCEFVWAWVPKKRQPEAPPTNTTP